MIEPKNGSSTTDEHRFAPIAEQPRLTRKVNAFAGVCLSAYLCLSVVSSFQLPNLG